jgi:hypothetical protein
MGSTFLGFYSGWAKDIVNNSNSNNNKGSTNQILGRKKLFIKGKSIITS